MDNIHIRRAIPSEQNELEQLQRRASLNNQGDREALLAHPDAIEVPAEQILAGDVLVAEFDGVIAGFAAVQSRADGESDLDALFVDPDLQRRGIGRLLIEHCAEFARTRGSSALYVVGNPHAKDFYTTCGFETIGTTETRFGPALVLGLRI
jgi:N-acetylglutamate synthase-like GNAT family acetyltransferase